MNYILDYDKLQTGDIILESGKKLHSKAIQAYTKSNFSHAMICVEPKSIIHAEKAGIFSLNPQRLLVENKSDLKVLRLKTSMSIEEQNKIDTFLRMKIGSIYSVKDALLVVKLNNSDDKSKNEYQFCSRLVAQAYNQINYDLVKNIDFCSPEDINKSELLIEVKNIVREANDADIEFALTRNTIKENQKSMYEWLNKTRDLAFKKYKFEIHKANDVDNFLIKNPKEDKTVCDYMKQSGYLENYQGEIDNNLYRYNKEKFIEKYNDLKIELMDAIQGEFQKEPSLINRHRENYKNSILMKDQTGLIYFDLLTNLYRTLLSVSMSRLITLHEVFMELFQKGQIKNDDMLVFMNIRIYIEQLQGLGIEKYDNIVKDNKDI